MPEIALISVDLPAPLSPTRATTSPASTSKPYVVERLDGPEALRHSPQREEALRLIP